MSAQQPASDWDPIDWHALEPGGAKTTTQKDGMMPAWRDWAKETAVGVNAPVDFVLLDLVVSAALAIGNARAAMATADFAQPSVLWRSVVAPPSQRKSTAQNVFNSRAGKRPTRRLLPAGRGQVDDDDRGFPKRSP
jgi:hypothetical protein